MKRRDLLAMVPSALLIGCGDTSPRVVEKKKEPVAVAGLHALYQMYPRARTWAPDLQVVRVSSVHLTEVAPVPGKAGCWQATFLSPSLAMQRTYTFSVLEVSETLHEGVNLEPARGVATGSKPFLVGAAKVESDKAWEIALAKGSKYNDAHPGITISLELAMSRFVNPAWRVIWGENASASGQSVYVDAFEGTYLTTI
jgi:hypothetical protein